MSLARSNGADDFRWFEVLGGAAAAPDDAEDALALRNALAPGHDAVAEPADRTEATWPQLQARLAEALADDDHAWFEAIGNAAAVPSAAAHEGQRLRSALPPDGMDAPLATGTDTQAELLRRLAALAPQPVPTPATEPLGWWARWFGQRAARPGLAFAAMLALMVGIGVVWQGTPEHERERSVATEPRIGPGGAPTFDVSDPPAAARGLVEALAAAGVTASASDQGGYWIVRALLPDPPGAAVERLLRERRLDTPPDRLLEVVFVGKP